MTNGRFALQLLHPGLWGTWLVVGIFFVLVHLPLSSQIAIGRKLGRTIPYLSPYRHRVAKTNIDLCFKDLSESERTDILRRSLEATGIMFMETAHVYLRSPAKILRHSELIGIDVLENAAAKDRGVLLIGAHFTSLDVAGAIVSRRFDYDCVYRPPKNKVVAFLCCRARARVFGNMIPAGNVPHLLRALIKERRVVWYGADQDLGHRRSVWAPFFGVDAATIKAPSKICSKYGTEIVFMSHYRDEASMKWIVKFESVDDFPSGDAKTDATRLNGVIEEAVRRNPEQYYWIHRRFKSLENGKTRNYRAAA